MMHRDIPNTLSIVSYSHCVKCFEELPAGESMKNWARISVGFTKLGLQVWCVRHNRNIVHIDFEGVRHAANVTCEG